MFSRCLQMHCDEIVGGYCHGGGLVDADEVIAVRGDPNEVSDACDQHSELVAQ